MTNGAITNVAGPERQNSLMLMEYFLRHSLPAAAKAGLQDRPVIAALKPSTPSRQNRACWGPRRCATQSLGLALAIATSLCLFSMAAPAQTQNQTQAQTRQQLLQELDSGQVREALLLGQQAVSRWPDDAQFRHYLGLAYFETGDLKQAQEQLARARELNPKDSATHYDLALVFLSQQDYVRGADELEAAIKLDPTKALAHMLLGRAYLNSNRSLQAIEEFKTTLKLDPAMKLGHYHLGFAYFSLGRNDEAISEYKEELRQSGESPASGRRVGARVAGERKICDGRDVSAARHGTGRTQSRRLVRLGQSAGARRAVGSGGACFAEGGRIETEGPGSTLSTGARPGETWQGRRSKKGTRTLRRTEEGATGHGGHGHRTRSVRAIQRMRNLRVAVAAALLMTALSMALSLTTLTGGWILWGAAQTAPKHPAPANQSPAAKPVGSAPKVGAKTPATNPPLFVDVTRAAGIDFHLICGSREKLYIVETQCGGAAAFDYDNDGWMDILLVDGSSIEDYSAGKCHPPRLYHNNHDGTFTDVSAKSGLNFCGWGYGVAIGDYDNDGWEDVYITGFHGSALYHNNHDGTFTDVTAKAGVANPDRVGNQRGFRRLRQ